MVYCRYVSVRLRRKKGIQGGRRQAFEITILFLYMETGEHKSKRSKAETALAIEPPPPPPPVAQLTKWRCAARPEMAGESL